MIVVALSGSPRKKGNSVFFTRYWLKMAEDADADTHDVHLNRLRMKGCQGCYACKTTDEGCVVKDDMTMLLKKVAEADILVLSSPIYYFEPSAQLKIFLDRTFSYLRPDFSCRLEPGKKLLLILTQNSPEQDYCSPVIERYSQIFKNFYGFSQVESVWGHSLTPDTKPAKRDDILKQLEQKARILLA